MKLRWSLPLALLVAAPTGPFCVAEEAPLRPLLVTVDDLPIAGGGHDTAEERLAITEGLLGHLERHGIQAVGLVTWGNVRDAAGRALLERWLAAGHELGNHSYAHPSYSRTSIEDYRDDMERARREIQALLEPHGQQLRFFRFPYLREGDTPEKVAAMRAYLEESGQQNLPVTLDNQDWSFNRPWIEATAGRRRGGGRGHRRRLPGRAPHLDPPPRAPRGPSSWAGSRPRSCSSTPTPSARPSGDGSSPGSRRPATALPGPTRSSREPVLADPPAVVASRGYGAWDRLWQEQGETRAREAGAAALDTQAAAWNAGDFEAFCAVYAEDATYVSSTGLTRGRPAILARYRERFPDRAAMGTLSFEVLEARPASGVEVTMLGDAAPSRVHGVSVVARWRLTYADREPAEGVTLIVLHPRGDGWEIVQDASM